MPVNELSRNRHLLLRTRSDAKRSSRPKMLVENSQGTEDVI